MSERSPMQSSGWRDAGLFVLAISTLTIVYTVGNEHGVHPLAMLLVALLFAALVMISSQGGPGRDAARILLHPLSLTIGLITLSLETTYFLALLHVTPAEASLLSRIAIPLSMAAAWSILARRPRALALIGHFLILISIMALITMLDPAGRWPGTLYAFSTAAAFVARNFIAEYHPWNRAAGTIGERVRITGLVMLSAALLSWLVAGLLIALPALSVFEPLPLLPRPRDFLSIPTLACALVVGLLILPSMFYLSFSAVVKIKTENFVAVSAFIPAVTLLLQIAAGYLGIIKTYPLDPSSLALTAAIIVGTLVIVRSAQLALAPVPGSQPSG